MKKSEERLSELKTFVKFKRKHVDRLNGLFRKFGNPVVIERLLFDLMNCAIFHERSDNWDRGEKSSLLFLQHRLNEHIRVSYQLVEGMRKVYIMSQIMHLQMGIDQASSLNEIFSDFDSLKAIRKGLRKMLKTGLAEEKDENYVGERATQKIFVTEMIFHLKCTYKLKNEILRQYEKVLKKEVERTVKSVGVPIKNALVSTK